jgi:hypothetical protein
MKKKKILWGLAMLTDLLNTLLDFGNENVYRSIKLKLVTVDEKDNQVNLRK